MELSDRKKKILQAVIESYIQTAEPVGSKAISGVSGLSVSAATIRSEMAELEEMGYLEQPYTSAGRVPTPVGYRIYVNELMNKHKLPYEEMETINYSLKQRLRQLDKIIADAGQITANITNYPVYALAAAASQVTISRYDLVFIDTNTFIIVLLLSSEAVKNKLVRLPSPIEQAMLVKLATLFNARFTGITDDKITAQLISATERAAGDTVGLVAVITGFTLDVLEEAKRSKAYLAGASHLLEHPEYRDVSKAHRLMQYLSDDNELLKLPSPDASQNMKIMIGPENVASELKDSSVIVAKYDTGSDVQGLIGVVGPTRMDYSKVAARLDYIAKSLGYLLSSEAFPALGPGSGDEDNED